MKLLTNRLEIRPLSSQQLNKFVEAPEKLTEELCLNVKLEELSEHMRKVYHLKAQRIEESPSSLLYHTYFLIILKEERVAIGTIGLKGGPDDTGLVEVGYSISEIYQNKGYMSEALKSFSEWLMQFKEVSGINACTSKVNLASQKVLLKCGYDKIYDNCDMIIWRYTSI